MGLAIAKLLPLAFLAGGAALLFGRDDDDMPPGGVEDYPEPGGATPEGHRVHVVRYGDLPYYMCRYYTGMGSRFRELDAINPHILPFSGGHYAGWVPGQTVLLPASWHPFDKPVPPPESGGAAPAEEPLPEEDPYGYLANLPESMGGYGERVPEDGPEDYWPEGEPVWPDDYE